MRPRTLGFMLLSVLGAVALPVQADDDEDFAARLKPFDEVPSVSSVASGSFRAELNRSATALTYTLTYRNLEAAVQQAHIHFGDKDVNGGISIWLCSNLASPPTPPNTQPCPTTPEATITGTVGATETVGPTAQGIDAGQFAEIVRAIRNGVAYANVHSARFPGGEIRGQIEERRRGHHGNHDD